MTKNILVIGGTSGLGLELAELHSAMGHTVYITGRRDPQKANLRFLYFAIDSRAQNVVTATEELVLKIQKVHTLIYAAGYYQEGRIDALSEADILQMAYVGLIAPALLIRRLKNNPGKPLKVILITSSAQYTPREKEPMYTSVKAGLGMLGSSLALDPEIGKVVVAAPSGMKTPFWEEGKDVSNYLDAKWVAEQITTLSRGAFTYKYARILRDPPRVEVIEER